ncbi:MAG: hypothetical protein LBL86_03175 [Coriobacteriales bacterium]|jgi:hypothetical protein|nr:hypothetical protein [Coriobacteriales bacterium]
MIDEFANVAGDAVMDGFNAVKPGFNEGIEGIVRIFGSVGSVLAAIIFCYVLYRFIRKSGFGIGALVSLGFMVFFVVAAWWILLP